MIAHRMQATMAAEAEEAAAGAGQEQHHKPDFLRKAVDTAAAEARRLAQEKRYIEARRDEAAGYTPGGKLPAAGARGYGN